jgi:hypothetical protein
MLAQITVGPGAARRQPAPISHQFARARAHTHAHTHDCALVHAHACPHARTRINVRSPWAEFAGDKGKHDHTRETGLTAVTRQILRALADVLPPPASCTHTDPPRPREACTCRPNPALVRVLRPHTSHRAGPRPPGLRAQPPRALPQRCAGTHVQSKSSGSDQCPRSRSPSLLHAAMHTP